MKIIMFQYNKNVSAIIQENTLSQKPAGQDNALVSNRFIANGYEDRLLWEESASLRPTRPQEYAILSSWQ